MFQRTLLRLVFPLLFVIIAYNFGSGYTPVSTDRALPLINKLNLTKLAAEMPTPADTLLESAKGVYFVRPDGGSSERTGLAPSSGVGQPCAWDHPFRAIPSGSAPQIAGSARLISAAGSYQIGYGAPGTDLYEESDSFDCLMPPIPDGPNSAHPTQILGVGWETGWSDPPKLWGSGQPWFIVNLTDISNIIFACFEITNHLSCVKNHLSRLACNLDLLPSQSPGCSQLGDLGAYEIPLRTVAVIEK